LAWARTARGNSGGLSGRGARWWDALRGIPRPVIRVALLYFAPFLTLGPDLTGPLDWSIAGHAIAGERFLYVPGFALWSLFVWLAGRRTESERNWCQLALISCFFALLFAPLSYAWGSGGWLLYQAPVGIAQLFIALQLFAWSRAAEVEKGGALILAICATIEFLIFVVIQGTGWEKGCVYGLGLTCLEDSFVTLASSAAGAIALVLWLHWLARRTGRGGA